MTQNNQEPPRGRVGETVTIEVIGLKAVRRGTAVPVLIGDAVADLQGQQGILKALHDRESGGYLVTVDADGREYQQWDQIWGLKVEAVYERVTAPEQPDPR